ncbi:nuclear transport factor 2 family protein [Flavobacterium sp.]|uniref:nuclear transport factor 2 family protein n=1 Tax=Flavobacterium sp. TaxID=239 RepID=UPI001B59D45F|nr:nuclear transport factor 2 family protein [Flavobacterium sp.]MBP6182274.1 nuclear transport factor 2 family protein [Flavobacterium sp.]
MKIFNFIVISFLFVTTLTFGQSNDEQEIRKLEKYWIELLNNGDTTSLLKIWSKEYVVNNPNGEIVTPEKIVALMKSGHKFPKVERIIEKITFNQNVAIVMGKEMQQPANLTPYHEEWVPRRFTNVWIRSESGWQLTARQSSEVIKKNN